MRGNDLTHLCDELVRILESSVIRHKADAILLSGGLDTSTLACLASRRYRISGVTVFLDGARAPDISYSKLIAKRFGLKHFLRPFAVEEAAERVRDVIRILRTFDPMEIRNSVVVYIALLYAKELGFRSVMTGDAGDELFAGYHYMFSMSRDELGAYISRLTRTWFFSAKPLGEHIGLRVEQPYTDPEVVEFALRVPPELKVGVHDGVTYGKWIVRKAFEKLLPPEVVWRAKDPIEVGSGSTFLEKLIGKLVPDDEYAALTEEVKLRSREHAFYYRIFKEVVGKVPPPSENEAACPSCGGGIPRGGNFCRICGNPVEGAP